MTEVSVEQLKAKVKSASRSAVVTIVNNTPNTLAREPLQPPMHGEFVWPPAEQIAPGARASFALASKGFMIGTEALVAYRDPARPQLGQLLFHVSAPYIGQNKALCTPPPSAYAARVRDSGKGHLFECTFSVAFDAASDVPSRHSSVRSAASLCAESDSGAGSDAASGGGLVSPRVDIESDDWKIELKRAVRSVLVAINNRTSSTLVRQSLAIRHGIWRRPPPERIAPGEVVEFGSESDGFMIGTEGRVVYAPEEDRESHIVLLWENPFVGRPRFEPRLASADIVALQYVNSGNASEVVFDLQESDGEGKAVFGATYSEVVQAHDDAVLPPLLERIVEQLAKNGTSSRNRGLFTGVPSFAELRELRAAISLGKPLELERFSPASLGHVLKSFLLELDDEPLAPILLAYAGKGDPKTAGTPQARALLDKLTGLFAAIAQPPSDRNERSDQPERKKSTSAATSAALAAATSDGREWTPLTSHELAVVFAPVLVPVALEPEHSENKSAAENNKQMDAKLRDFRQNLAVLQMLIDKKRFG